MLGSRKAQAVLELAILGSLIIVAFSYAIKYSEQSNREQSYAQQTFRLALKKAKEINNAASLQTMDFRRMPNVASPMELGELQQFSSSNNVLWSDGKKDKDGKDTVSKSYFQLNRGTSEGVDFIEIPARPGLYNTPETSVTTYTTGAVPATDKATTVFKKEEAGGAIKTTKIFTATDTITGSTKVDGQPISLNSSLGKGGKYTTDGVGIHRSTTMQVAQ